MASGNVSLTVSLIGKGDLVSTLQKAERAATDFGNKTRTAGEKAATGFAKLRGQISGLSFKQVSLGVAGFAASVTGAALAFKRLNDAARESLSIEAAFKRNFENVAGSVNVLREALNNTLDDTSIQKLANRAGKFGLNIKQIADAMKVARGVAFATGEEFEATFNKLIEGAARGSTRFNTIAGTTVDFQGAQRGLAEQMGVTTTQLTEADKRATNLAAAFKELAEIVRSGKFGPPPEQLDQVDQLTASWENMLDTLGRRTVKTTLAFWDSFNGTMLDTHQLQINLANAFRDEDVALGSLSDAFRDYRKMVDDSKGSVVEHTVAVHSQIDALLEWQNLEIQNQKFLAALELEQINRKMLSDLATNNTKRRRSSAARKVETEDVIQHKLTLAETENEFNRIMLEASRGFADAEQSIADERLYAQRLMLQAQLELEAEAHNARILQQQQFIDTMQDGFGTVQNVAAQMGGAYGNAVQQSGRIFELFTSNQKDLTKAVPGTLGALGNLTAGFVKNKKAQAAISGAFELAQGFATLFINPAESASHFVASGLYFAIAGGAGGGKGKDKGSGISGGAGASTLGSGGGGSAPGSGGAKSETTIVINGFVGSESDLGRGIARATQRLDGTGLATAGL